MRAFVLAISLLVIAGNAFSQDPVFSQMQFGLTYMNPAYAGYSSDFVINTQNRLQWTSTPGTYNFNSVSMNVGCPVSGIGFGLHAYNGTQGEGFLTTNQLSGLVSATRQLGRLTNMTAGLQLGAGQNQLDWGNFTFNSQLDPYFGQISDVSNIRPQRGNSNAFVDVSAGLKFRTLLGNKRLIGNQNSYLSGGFAMFHINRPEQSFFGNQERQSIRYTGHVFFYMRPRTRMRYSTDTEMPTGLGVGLVYNFQNPVQTNTLSFHYYSHRQINLSLGIRRMEVTSLNENWDSVIPSVAYYTDFNDAKSGVNLEVGYSIDLPIFELGAGNRLLTHEIGLTITFPNRQLCFGIGNGPSKKKRVSKARRDGCFTTYPVY